MNYEKPNMELVNLEVKDIITTSQVGEAEYDDDNTGMQSRQDSWD